MKLLITFIILNILNVIIQTIKSIATVKCKKFTAAVVNAVAYGLYTVVTVYMLCELSLGIKALIVALCNLVGVFFVKLVEEKSRKDKLWKVEATLPNNNTAKEAISKLKEKDIPLNYIDIEKYVIVNCYCSTKEQSTVVKTILSNYGVKYFVNESKTL